MKYSKHVRGVYATRRVIVPKGHLSHRFTHPQTRFPEALGVRHADIGRGHVCLEIDTAHRTHAEATVFLLASLSCGGGSTVSGDAYGKVLIPAAGERAPGAYRIDMGASGRIASTPTLLPPLVRAGPVRARALTETHRLYTPGRLSCGAFAWRKILRGSHLGDYALGSTVHTAVEATREARADGVSAFKQYEMGVYFSFKGEMGAWCNRSLVVDGNCLSNPFAFLNDPRGSCEKPNVTVEGYLVVSAGRRVTLVLRVIALEDIQRGAELLFDYGEGYWVATHAKRTFRRKAAERMDAAIHMSSFRRGW